MKIVHANDIHFTSRARTRKDSWPEAIFSVLDQIERVAVKADARVVALAGDIFHDTHVSWEHLARLIQWGRALRARGVEVLAVAGNHDERHDRYESVHALPYGVLVSSGAIVDISRRTHTIDGVEFAGVPYPDAMELEAYARIPWEGSSDVQRVVLAHCFATPDGGMCFHAPSHKYCDLHTLQPGVSVWHFGHDHSDHGVCELEGAQFINIGAVERGSLATDELGRTPQVAVSDPSTGTVARIALRVPPASEVFDLVAHEERRVERSKIEKFVEDLAAHLAQTSTGVPLDQRVEAMGLPHEVKRRVFAYLESQQ